MVYWERMTLLATDETRIKHGFLVFLSAFHPRFIRGSSNPNRDSLTDETQNQSAAEHSLDSATHAVQCGHSPSGVSYVIAYVQSFVRGHLPGRLFDFQHRP